jgi:hypothetical protein
LVPVWDRLGQEELPEEWVKNALRISVSGSPAVLGKTRRPEALRPYLSAGLPFSVKRRLYQLTEWRQEPVFHNLRINFVTVFQSTYVNNQSAF